MLKIFITACFLFLFSTLTQGAKLTQIDLSEKILKLDANIIHPFGKNGFGIYDKGDKKFKIFNWDFQITGQIPISNGESPAEVKNIILTASLINDELFISAFGDNKIKIFDRKGPFIQCKTFGITPRRIVFKQGKLFLFNSNFSIKEKAALLAKVIDPKSGTTLKEITLQDNILSTKTQDQEASLTGLTSFFDIGDNNHIYLFNGYEHTLFEIDENGRLIAKTDLPFKMREKRRIEKRENRYETVVSTLDFYTGMELFENVCYITFLKTIKTDKDTGAAFYRTIVMKIYRDGKHVEKTFDGAQSIMGKNGDTLYLFNFDEYRVTPVNTGSWK